METRPFGRTGELLPILSFGAQRLCDEEGVSEDLALQIMNSALDRGIRYFDTAWMYSVPNGTYRNGQSEQRVGMVAKRRRTEMWIATKAIARARDEARRQLEESLARLQTDHVEEWRFHDVQTMDELDKITGPAGALEAAIGARDEGLIRYISLSGHKNPQVQVEALRRFPFDSMLVAVSAVDHFVYDFGEEFLPVAARHGAGVVGMKVFALGKLGHVPDLALRFALGLPLTTVIVGIRSMAELETDLRIAEQFTPLTAEERVTLLREAMPLVKPENMPWKAQVWGSPDGWHRREEPTPSTRIRHLGA